MFQILTAAPQRHKWLTIYPLLSANGQGPTYELLPDAIRAGTLRITEVGSGTVGELLAINEGDRDVLVLDGEQFIGARQNRMASRSILLPAHSKTTIPVNCMEHGRWRRVTRDFQPSPYYSPPKVRVHNKRSERARVEEGSTPQLEDLRLAQGPVWGEIEFLSSDMGAHSPTSALNEVVDRRAEDLNAWRASFASTPGQIGILAFLGDVPLGIDLLGSAALYERVHERMLGGYIQDALRVREDPARTPDPEAAEQFLGRMKSAPREEAPTVGRGVYRVIAGEVTGGELEDEGQVAHLSAFPK